MAEATKNIRGEAPEEKKYEDISQEFPQHEISWSRYTPKDNEEAATIKEARDYMIQESFRRGGKVNELPSNVVEKLPASMGPKAIREMMVAQYREAIDKGLVPKEQVGNAEKIIDRFEAIDGKPTRAQKAELDAKIYLRNQIEKTGTLPKSLPEAYRKNLPEGLSIENLRQKMARELLELSGGRLNRKQLEFMEKLAPEQLRKLGREKAAKRPREAKEKVGIFKKLGKKWRKKAEALPAEERASAEVEQTAREEKADEAVEEIELTAEEVVEVTGLTEDTVVEVMPGFERSPEAAERAEEIIEGQEGEKRSLFERVREKLTWKNVKTGVAVGGIFAANVVARKLGVQLVAEVGKASMERRKVVKESGDIQELLKGLGEKAKELKAFDDRRKALLANEFKALENRRNGLLGKDIYAKPEKLGPLGKVLAENLNSELKDVMDEPEAVKEIRREYEKYWQKYQAGTLKPDEFKELKERITAQIPDPESLPEEQRQAAIDLKNRYDDGLEQMEETVLGQTVLDSRKEELYETKLGQDFEMKLAEVQNQFEERKNGLMENILESSRIPEEKKKELLAMMEAVSERLKFNGDKYIKELGAEVADITGSYLRGKYDKMRLFKEASNTILVGAGLRMFRGMTYAGITIAERWSKMGKKYEQEHQEDEAALKKGWAKLGYKIKGTLYDSVVETYQEIVNPESTADLAALKAEMGEEEWKKSGWKKRLTTRLRAVGNIAVFAGMGGGMLHEYLTRPEGLIGMESAMDAAINQVAEKGMFGAIMDNYVKNFNHMTFGTFNREEAAASLAGKNDLTETFPQGITRAQAEAMGMTPEQMKGIPFLSVDNAVASAGSDWANPTPVQAELGSQAGVETVLTRGNVSRELLAREAAGTPIPDVAPPEDTTTEGALAKLNEEELKNRWELGKVKKGEGFIHAIRRQFRNDEELAKKFGFDPTKDNLQRWSSRKAYFMCRDQGYLGRGVRFNKDNPISMVIGNDGKVYEVGGRDKDLYDVGKSTGPGKWYARQEKTIDLDGKETRVAEQTKVDGVSYIDDRVPKNELVPGEKVMAESRLPGGGVLEAELNDEGDLVNQRWYHDYSKTSWTDELGDSHHLISGGVEKPVEVVDIPGTHDIDKGTYKGYDPKSGDVLEYGYGSEGMDVTTKQLVRIWEGPQEYIDAENQVKIYQVDVSSERGAGQVDLKDAETAPQKMPDGRDILVGKDYANRDKAFVEDPATKRFRLLSKEEKKEIPGLPT